MSGDLNAIGGSNILRVRDEGGKTARGDGFAMNAALDPTVDRFQALLEKNEDEAEPDCSISRTMNFYVNHHSVGILAESFQTRQQPRKPLFRPVVLHRHSQCLLLADEQHEPFAPRDAGIDQVPDPLRPIPASIQPL